MNQFDKNQRVFIKKNTETDKWIPTNGRSGGLWIKEVKGDQCTVFDGQATFDVPKIDLERGDESKDINYF
jgi:hypothetical protein